MTLAVGLRAIPPEWVREVERSEYLLDVGARLAAARGL
jgi:hypothetical protein